MSIKLTNKRIGEHLIDISVDNGGGFNAEFDGQSYSTKTLIELETILAKAVKRAAQQGVVDVTVLGITPTPNTHRGYDDGAFKAGPDGLHAKLRSKHERQHSTWLLVTDDLRVSPAKRFQVSSYSREGIICRRLTDEEIARYRELCEVQRAATTAVEDFVGQVKISADEALRDARKAKD